MPTFQGFRMCAPAPKKSIMKCEAKRRYSDEFAARGSASETISRNHPKPPVLWVYRCTICHGWHITGNHKKTKRQQVQDYRYAVIASDLYPNQEAVRQSVYGGAS